MTEKVAEKNQKGYDPDDPRHQKDYDPNDPRNQVAKQTTNQDAGPGEPGYYNPPNPNFGVTHTASNEIRPPEVVAAAEAIPGQEEENEARAKAAKGQTKSKGEDTDSDTDYESMTVPELRDLAHQRGIDVASNARKEEIIDALEEG